MTTLIKDGKIATPDCSGFICDNILAFLRTFQGITVIFSNQPSSDAL